MTRCSAVFTLVAGLLLLTGTAWTAARSDDAPSRGGLAPIPKAAPDPTDNPTTPDKVALGKQLFFDPRLSGDNTMSCTTCHLPERAFADGLPRARGCNGKELARNTPTLLNAGLFSRFLWDGRARRLEEQALGPIRSPDEMNQNLAELVQELNGVPGYVEQFQKVFGTTATPDGIAKALAAFERTLMTGPSPFDRYLSGDKNALSESAKRGMELFQGDAGCVQCHQGPLLSDGQFYRLGVSFKDEGLVGVTGKKEDTGKFRTPSLRNIAQTAPYMHDGSMKTLDEVVTFYYRGVPSATTDGFVLDIQPLSGQSYSEIPDIVAFLESLTGQPPKIGPPELPQGYVLKEHEP